jgi:hypothetical protein
MSRQLEQHQEDKNNRRRKAIVNAVEFELLAAIRHSGAEPIGLAINFRAGDCLIVVKGMLAGRRQVAFVGAQDCGGALIKVGRLARADKLVWKEDRYVGKS